MGATAVAVAPEINILEVQANVHSGVDVGSVEDEIIATLPQPPH